MRASGYNGRNGAKTVAATLGAKPTLCFVGWRYITYEVNARRCARKVDTGIPHNCSIGPVPLCS